MTDKKNIIFISHYNAMNGANQSLLLLLKNIDRFVNIKKVFVHNPGSKNDGFYNQLKKNRIPVENVNLQSFLYYKRTFLGPVSLPVKLLKSMISFLKILKYLETENIDVIYSNSSMETYGVFLAKFLNIRHIWHIREFGFKDYKLKHIFGDTLKRRVLNYSSCIIAISKSIYDYIDLSSKTTIIYNGIVSAKDLDNAGIILPSAKKLVTLGMVGLISPTKNQLRALRALNNLKKAGHVVNLILWGDIGSTSYEKTLKEYIENHNLDGCIFFRGFNNNKNKIYNSMDILLMCSPYEAFGRVTVEAMSYGVPVVGYDNAGTAEIIQHKESGLLFDDKNDFLEDQLLLLLNDAAIWEKIQRGSKETASKYTIENYTSSVLKVIINE